MNHEEDQQNHHLNAKETKAALNKENEADDPLEVLLAHVGAMRCYMKILMAAMGPVMITAAFMYFVQMFITLTPEKHWCWVPELEGLDAELRRNLSAPLTATGERDRCSVYQANWSEVLATLKPPPGDTPTKPCRQGWEFEFTDVPYKTITTEREWVCDSASYVPTAQSAFFVGTVFGGLIFGPMADRYGRVPALVASNIVACVGGVLSIFTTGLWDFAICRFIAGTAFDNCYMLLYILVLEYLDSKHRSLAANLTIATYFGSGSMAMPWMAIWIADWRKLLLVTSLPMLIVIAAPWVVPESARWLVSRGRVNKALDVLKKFERIDGFKIPQKAIDDFVESSQTSEESNESLTALFRSPPLRKMMVYTALVSVCCAVAIDGIIRMSTNLGGDFFIVFTLTSASEIPSIIVLVMVIDRMGRRSIAVWSTAAAGVLIVIGAFLPKGTGLVALMILARFFINMNLNAIVQWTTELLPTGARASASGALHTVVLIGVILSPFIVYSEKFWTPLPLLIFGGLALVSSGFCMMLPETKGLPMTQTIADGERLMNSYSLCGRAVSDVELQDVKEKRTALLTQ